MTYLERHVLEFIGLRCQTLGYFPKKSDIANHVLNREAEHAINALDIAGLIERVTVRRPRAAYRYRITPAGEAALKGAVAA